MERRGVHGGLLTLTTDFGTRDHYVGTMKGVVATLAPGVTVVDITHQVRAFDIAAGAFAIAQAYRYFPPGTVHVVVIDPGVGSARRAVAVQAASQYFVAPDNGVLALVLDGCARFEARSLDPRHGLPALSNTFHGRDLFAPAGARLAAGLPFAEIGPVARDLRGMEGGATEVTIGTVLHVDVFGNVVTSFRSKSFPRKGHLVVSDTVVSIKADSYDAMPAGQLCMIEGSSGFVEVSVNRGSAAERLGVSGGEQVIVGVT